MIALVSRLARTSLAKLGAHCLLFGFEFGFSDFESSGLASALAGLYSIDRGRRLSDYFVPGVYSLRVQKPFGSSGQLSDRVGLT